MWHLLPPVGRRGAFPDRFDGRRRRGLLYRLCPAAVLLRNQLDGVPQLIFRLEAHGDLRRMGTDEPGHGPVAEHKIWHGLPFAAVLEPAFMFGQPDGDERAFHNLTGGQFLGHGPAAPVVISLCPLELVADGREAPGIVERGQQELGCPGGASMHNINVLHDSQGVGLHTHGHVQGHDAAADGFFNAGAAPPLALFVGIGGAERIGHEGDRDEHAGHALEVFKAGDGLQADGHIAGAITGLRCRVLRVVAR